MIGFIEKNEEIIISIVKAEKEQGSRDIEFDLRETIAGEWADQVIYFSQFKTEIIEKAREYIQIISANNAENLEINKLKENLDNLQNV